MDSFIDSKLMAKRLRQALADRKIELSHSDALELMAQQYGLANWNVLSAAIDAAQRRNEAMNLPEGWTKTGQSAQLYNAGLDDVDGPAVLVESRNETEGAPDGSFCTIMQTVLAAPYRGKKLRLSAELRGKDVAGFGTIWLRIDGAAGPFLRFNNLETSKSQMPVSGTTGWVSRQIVLDVPEPAATVHYGFFLNGNGRLWARGFSIEVVSDAVEITQDSQSYLSAPTNLDLSLRRAN